MNRSLPCRLIARATILGYGRVISSGVHGGKYRMSQVMPTRAGLGLSVPNSDLRFFRDIVLGRS
jgi:hypothetical protein